MTLEFTNTIFAVHTERNAIYDIESYSADIGVPGNSIRIPISKEIYLQTLNRFNNNQPLEATITITINYKDKE